MLLSFIMRTDILFFFVHMNASHFLQLVIQYAIDCFTPCITFLIARHHLKHKCEVYIL